MNETGLPLLSLIVFLPLLGAVALSFVNNDRLVKLAALAVAVLELILALWVTMDFDAADGQHFQFTEQQRWIPSLGAAYMLGVDGISVLFLPMSALLTVSAILASWQSAHLKRLHFALLLILEGVTMGVFCAQDMLLFFIFWELTLAPIFLLMGLWGIGPKRRNAAVKYTLMMLTGGVPLLFAIIILAINHADFVGGSVPQNLPFSLPVLLETPLPESLQGLVFLLLLLGFAVKAPLMPFHTWLPTAAMEGPTQLTALLTGLKLGAFGILRFALPLAPSAAVQYSWILGILGAITLIYGALIALQQTNLRRLLAYASISHVGLVIIGIASLNMQGLQGAIFQLLNFSLIASSLMLIAGFLQHRLGSTELVHLGGLAKVMPRLVTLTFIFVLASIGVPGTSGFPAELLLLIGAFTAHTGIAVAALAGAILGAAYMLSFTRRAFFGPIKTNQTLNQDLRPREFLLLAIPAALVLLLGFFPNSLLNTQQLAAEAWLTHLLEQPEIKIQPVAEFDKQ
jgi:NADH-quinone oxidoreductase subunit M